MQHQTVISGPSPKVHLRAIPGDLRLSGWERSEIAAKTKGDMLQLVDKESGVEITCDDDLMVNLPSKAALDIESVSGDANLRGLSGDCRIVQISGDLSGRNLGSLQAENVGGDLSLRGALGNVSAASVGGDVSLRAVQADISLQAIGGDLYLRGASGNLLARVNSDAVLYIKPRPGVEIDLHAGGDILLRLPTDADARLELQGGSSDAVHINLPNVAFDKESQSSKITLGNGRARICLIAGGEITVTTQAEEWQSAADFDFDIDIDFPPLPDDFFGHIERQAERTVRQAERARRNAEAAMQRAEQKMQEAERRIQTRVNARVGRWGMDWRGSIPRPPAPPVPPSEAVGDEERLTILHMLAKKKITAEEAEKLLDALE